MSVELVTGHAGEAHVSAGDVGALLSCVFGRGAYYAGEAPTVMMKDANTVKFAWKPTELLIHGRHVHMAGSDEVKIKSGQQTGKRNDLVVARYANSGGIESVALAVVEGQTGPTGVDPTTPEMGASILDGAAAVDVSIARVSIDALTPSVEWILPPMGAALGGAVSVASATVNGTLTATSGKLAGINISNSGLKAWLLANVFKVGYVWTSYVNESPQSILGGTWVEITGRFPYFNHGTGTGGANSVTLTVDQMPKHSHSAGRSNTGSGSTQWGLENYGAYGGEVLLTPLHGTSTSVTSTGGGKSFNNMPAYQTLYAWRRTK